MGEAVRPDRIEMLCRDGIVQGNPIKRRFGVVYVALLADINIHYDCHSDGNVT